MSTTLNQKKQATQTERACALFAALSDPCRLEVVKLLLDKGRELCVCDIASHFKIGQPTISHHLKILREVGFVSMEKRGKWVYYSAEKQALEDAKKLLEHFLSPAVPSEQFGTGEVISGWW